MMSPTYTTPSFEAIQEPVASLAVSTKHFDRVQHPVPLDIPRVKARRHSTKPDRPSRKTTGSPQLHHFLRKGDGAGDETRSHIPVPATRPGLRRYSSADYVLAARRDVLAREEDSEGTASAASPRPSRPYLLAELRAQKRVRLSPVSPRTVAPRSGSAAGTIEESSREELEAAEDWPLPVEKKDVGIVVKMQNDGIGATPRDALRRLTGDTTDEEKVPESATDDEPTPWRGSGEATLKPPSPAAQSIASDSSHSATSSPHSVTSTKTADTEVSSFEDGSEDSNPGACSHDPDEEQTPIAPVPMSTFPLHINTQATHHIASSKNRGSLPPPRKTRNRGRSDPHRYGTPEMPRGTAKLPHIPSTDLTNRLPPSHTHPKHLPRAEKLPLSGYELLASTISASGSASASMSSRHSVNAFLGGGGGSTSSYPHHHLYHRKRSSRRNSVASFASAPAFSGVHGVEEQESTQQQQQTIKPIYRRFEALNHRLLLQLQDELSELEEQLHRLDTTDTQTRRLQSSILPASRRAEFLAGGELQWHKTDILNKIGSKLGQYNHLLSSFTATRDLPAPALTDINEYRAYLDTHQPISEVETRFLDPIDDLVSLAAPVDDDNSSSSSASATESEPRTRPTSQEYLRTLRLLNTENSTTSNAATNTTERIVTPIPGTMHGNSWRHNRPASISHSQAGGSPRTSIAGSNSPRFARVLEPRTTTGTPSPHLLPPPPSSPLRHEHPRPRSQEGPRKDQDTTGAAGPMHMTVHMAFAMAVAVLVPVLMFSVIPGFAGRFAVIMMVGLSVFGSLAAQVGEGGKGRGMELGRDFFISTALYGGVMAAVAGIVN